MSDLKIDLNSTLFIEIERWLLAALPLLLCQMRIRNLPFSMSHTWSWRSKSQALWCNGDGNEEWKIDEYKPKSYSLLLCVHKQSHRNPFYICFIALSLMCLSEDIFSHFAQVIVTFFNSTLSVASRSSMLQSFVGLALQLPSSHPRFPNISAIYPSVRSYQPPTRRFCGSLKKRSISSKYWPNNKRSSISITWISFFHPTFRLLAFAGQKTDRSSVESRDQPLQHRPWWFVRFLPDAAVEINKILKFISATLSMVQTRTSIL